MKLYIGENLKKLRADKGVTQDALAEYLGVSYQAVSRWENGAAYPDIELLPEIARYFEVSLEELLGCENDEKEAEIKAMHLSGDRWERDKNEILRELRELEKQYPNNWKIKEMICDTLVDTEPEFFDDILPELRKYAYEALKAFPLDNDRRAEWFVRNMVIAAPEEEVDEWAAKLEDHNLNNCLNVMKLRYQLRKDLEKAKHYESMQKIDQLNDLLILGSIPELSDDTLESRIYPAQLSERILDAVIGIPYRDEEGKVHNSIMLFNRLDHYFTIVVAHIGYRYCDGSEKMIADGLAALEKMVDYALLYADAVKEGYFVSDNPYFEPQEVGKHRRVYVVEQQHLRELSLDYHLYALRDGMIYPPLREDERFRTQIRRMLDKKAELEEYWKTHA